MTTYTSAQVTEAFLNWYGDKTPAKLNTLMLYCSYPCSLAIQREGAKHPGRSDLTKSDLMQACLIAVWETIIRCADEIAIHAREHGIVGFLAQNAQWGVLKELGSPMPTSVMQLEQRKSYARICRCGETAFQETGYKPNDEELVKLAGITPWCLQRMRARLRHRRLDSNSAEAWAPGRSHDYTRLENRELLAKALLLVSKRQRWFLRHRYLLGQSVAEMQAARPDAMRAGAVRASVSKAGRRAGVLARAEGLGI